MMFGAQLSSAEVLLVKGEDRPFMRGVGFEPTQIALRELESRALTTRPSSLLYQTPDICRYVSCWMES